MKPLKLYAKTTLLISAVVVAVFATAVYFYNSATTSVAREQRRKRAELLAALMAEVIGIEHGDGEIVSLRNAIIQFKRTRQDVTDIHIYSYVNGDLCEAIGYPELSTPPTPEFLDIIKQQPAYSELDDRQSPFIIVRSSAPIRNSRGITGVVIIELGYNEREGLAHDLNQLALILLTITVLLITVLIYWLFRSIIYKPLERLHNAMMRIESGDFSARAPVEANDEIGMLSLGFNNMAARLNEMGEQQKAYEQHLKERVKEAVSESAERNEQLEAANLQLFEIKRRITQLERLAAAGRLAAQFAHEVGTPLNLISGHVQLLETRLKDEKSAHRLNIIAAQIERIERIVRHMLDSTRRPKAEMRPLNVNALLQNIFEATQPMLASRNVDLTTELSPDLPLTEGDAEQLQQVFLNLIDNGIDAMLAGGVLHFVTYANGDSIFIECDDNGEGIPEEIKERIFDPLFTTKERGHGTGLGLSIALQIIEEHHGQLNFESRVGFGTKFTIKLPTNGSLAAESAEKNSEPITTI